MGIRAEFLGRDRKDEGSVCVRVGCGEFGALLFSGFGIVEVDGVIKYD